MNTLLVPFPDKTLLINHKIRVENKKMRNVGKAEAETSLIINVLD